MRWERSGIRGILAWCQIMVVGDQPLSRRAWILLIGISMVSGGTVVLGFFAYELWSFDPSKTTVMAGIKPSDPFIRVRIRGIERPSTVKADLSTLDPDEMVIGFVVDGRARAYRLDALRKRTEHVVNDVVGDVPITVSYCDIDNCIRGYTGPAGQGPLKVSIGGLFEGREMVLEFDRGLYFQRSGKAFEPSSGTAILPLERIEPTLTNWSLWKQDHPDTDVYEGVR
jgi:hypothetical protein